METRILIKLKFRYAQLVPHITLTLLITFYKNLVISFSGEDFFKSLFGKIIP